jgi:dUTP pyrophosphatase
MKVKFKKLHPNAKIPTYAKSGDAGMDLFACLDGRQWPSDVDPKDWSLYIAPGERMLVPTELSMELPNGYEAQIRPKSGLALHHGVTVLNSPGTVDEGYRGPIGVILINHSDSGLAFKVTNGMKIAQMVIKPVESVEVEEVVELTDSERGSGGFGSTGT